MRFVGAVAAIAVLALAGCGQWFSPDPPPPPPPPRAKPSVPAAKPDPVAFNPEVLIGADEVGVHSRLGPPATMREQPPSTVWVYGDDVCRLSVFFFLDVNSDKLRVLSYELKVVDDTETGQTQCLQRLGIKGNL